MKFEQTTKEKIEEARRKAYRVIDENFEDGEFTNEEAEAAVEGVNIFYKWLEELL